MLQSVVNVHLSCGQQGMADAAIQVEHLWDEIARTIRSGYSLRVCVEQLSARTGKPHLRKNLCGALRRFFPVNGATISRTFQPAASKESLPELRGTRAWIVVPPPGCDWMEISPLTNCIRSRMLMSPKPRRYDGVLRVKANSQVAHGQLNLSLCTVQFHFEVPHTTVLHRILQSFL